MDLTNEEIEQKRLEVITKFKKKFIEDNLSIDAHTHKAVELLTRGVNPYEIIEHLIETNQKLFHELVKAHSLLPPKPILMTVEHSSETVSRYFIIVGATYELSTDSLETVVKVIKNIPIDEIMLLDTVERKWIDVEKLLKQIK